MDVHAFSQEAIPLTMVRLRLETSRIRDWDSFHSEFARLFGFPGFYGRNMDAWIDCMSSITESQAGMSGVCVERGHPLLLEVTATTEFKTRCREQFDALVECTALVNQRFLGAGERSVICVMFLDK